MTIRQRRNPVTKAERPQGDQQPAAPSVNEQAGEVMRSSLQIIGDEIAKITGAQTSPVVLLGVLVGGQGYMITSQGEPQQIATLGTFIAQQLELRFLKERVAMLEAGGSVTAL